MDESGEKDVFLDIRNGTNGTNGTASGSSAADAAPEQTSFGAKLPEVLACSAAVSFHFGLGLVLAYSASLLPQLEAPDSDIQLSRDQASLVASVAALSVPVGSLLTGPVIEALGRLLSVKLAAVPYIVGCALIATADGFPMLLAGRFLTGIASGTIGTNPGIVYVTEVGRPELRGALISLGPFMVSLGTLLSYILGAYLHWRTLSWMFVAAPLLTVGALTLAATESPVWLVSKGRKDQALRSLQFLARSDPVRLARVEQELAALVHADEQRRASQRRGLAAFLGALFMQRTGLRPLLLLMVLFILQQFAGIYVTLFFAVGIFKDVGSALDPNTASILVGAIRVVTSVQATAMIRRFGRRPLLMLSAALCAASMFVSGYFARMVAVAQEAERASPTLVPLVVANTTMTTMATTVTLEVVDGGLSPWVRWVPAVALLSFVYCGMLGMLTIPWTMTAELYAPRVRSLGQGVTVAMANFFMFCAVQSYKDLTVLLGGVWAVHWFYGSVALSAVLFVYLFVPETHRRTLAEIEEYFSTSLVYPLYQRRRRRQRELMAVNRGDTP